MNVVHMSDYAVVVTCSYNQYLFGLNALLNGLDYYGNTADVHVLILQEEETLWTDYKAKVLAAGFGFEVFFIPIQPLLEDTEVLPNCGVMWYLTFGRWHYTKHLVGTYKAVLHTGTDVMVWHNIMSWFEVAAATDFIIMGHNALGTYNWPDAPYVQSNDVPYADTPCFVSPERHYEALDYVCHIGANYMDVADMPAVFYALRKFNKRVILLPDNHWVRNYVQSCYIMKDICKKEGDPLYGKTIYLDASSRYIISMVHGKYWSKVRFNNTMAIIESETADPMLRDVWRVNWTRSYEACKFFNTQCKLLLSWREDL